jgi:hypothetical protein
MSANACDSCWTTSIGPAWEYDHQIGKRITGGFVYRGKAILELVGADLYGDYVSGRLWAVRIARPMALPQASADG